MFLTQTSTVHIHNTVKANASSYRGRDPEQVILLYHRVKHAVEERDNHSHLQDINATN